MLPLEEYKQRDSFYGKEMCELISCFWKEVQYWEDDKLNNWTPNQIWNYSPTGELFMLDEWFEQARLYYKLIPCSKCKEYKQIAKIDIDYGEQKDEVLISSEIKSTYIYLCEKCL